ncbi:MAG: helix-turn-helix domain-containing protein [Phascolarctobacterium sp.]|nr:helix-turn-helix domain-containing protein [Phascolarctobacterium sp.]
MSDNKNKALTLAERQIIETGIRNGSTKAAIAKTLGKDNSTIGKEIKAHRTRTQKCNLPLECSAYRKCVHGRKCTAECPDYSPFKCPRRDRSPGTCNGCSIWRSCRFDKYTYDAAQAEHEYRSILVDSRQGVNLTTSEAKTIASVVGPLLKQGLSPYRIVAAHPELDISEKTLYNYIEWGVLEIGGVCNLDLRRKPSRRLPKKAAGKYKKREDRAFLKGRLYQDYLHYMEENPLAHVLQMDTVYNDVSYGPFMQTFKFIDTGMMIAVYHDGKTAQDMVAGLDTVESFLGPDLFNKWVEVLLTDRGGEFTAADAFENRPDGTKRTRVFYCDPMQSGQKGSLEVNHEQLRYIFPKGTDLRGLGLTGQEALNLALSHINSAAVESLSGKSPIEFTRFLCPELWEKLMAAGIREIPKDEIILKPYLLKSLKTR